MSAGFGVKTTRMTHAVVWLALVSVGFGVLVSALDGGLAWPVLDGTFGGLGVVVLNVLPFLALVGVLVALTRRVLLSTWLGLLVLVAVYAANHAKFTQLQMPLLPGDFRFLLDLPSALPLFTHYVGHDARVLAALVAVLAISVSLAWEPITRGLRGRSRAALGAACSLFVVGLVAGWTPWRAVYDAERLRFEPWSVVDSAERAGVVGNLVLYHWELARRDELAPDHAAAVDLLREHADMLRTSFAPNGTGQGMASGILPDIVIVQSESLFDPVRLAGAPADTYLPNYHRLARRGLAGEMHVPTFAGGTIRTEFEVLTGLALAFFPGVQYPYFEIADRPLPGLVRTLARHGYRSTAIHPNSGVFWNRNEAFRQIGFDLFIDEKAFSPDDIVGLFTGDAALTDHVLAELDDAGPPQLVFAISMQNHGPFDWRPGLDEARLAAQPLPTGLDSGGAHWLRNYLYMAEDADRELGRLADALQKRGRRTLLLFYGDHLPALPPVYQQIGFADGLGAKTQPVPWLLLDNARVLRKDGREPRLSWLLPSLLLEAAGIGGDRWFATLDALRSALALDVEALAGSAGDGLRALGQLRYRDELDGVIDIALAPPEDDWSDTVAP